MIRLLVVILLLSTLACGREVATSESATVTTTTAASTPAATAPAAATPAPAASATPLALVQSVYDEYAWEPVGDESTAGRESLFSQPESVLDRYFDDSFKAAILKDRACMERTKEICNLDFLPIWQAQDPSGIKNVKVTAGSEPNSVIARFSGAFDEAMQIRYSMSETPRGWRISDIHYDEGPSIKTILTQ